MALSLHDQLTWLWVLPIPIACVTWTVTHEEVFREPRDYCIDRSRTCARLLSRKFFYLFTCEYCFSHYVTVAALALTDFRLLLDDWRGLLLAYFALVAVSNVYLSVYARLRVDIKSEKVEIEARERVMEGRVGSADGEKAAQADGR